MQSSHDFIVFGTLAVGSFASGSLLTSYGWDWVVGPMLPLVLLAVLSLGWLARVRR